MTFQKRVTNAQKMQNEIYDKIIKKDDDLTAIIEQCFTIIELFIKQTDTSKDERTKIVREIIKRVNSSAKACTILSLNGYGMSSMSSMRDVVESEYLLRYFILNPEKIQVWWKSDKKTRLKKFSPSFLRRKIAGSNIKLKEKLDADYQGHSEIGIHVTPYGLTLSKGFELKSSDITYDKTLIEISLVEIADHLTSISNIVGLMGSGLVNKKMFDKEIKKLNKTTSKLRTYRLIAAVLAKNRLLVGKQSL